MTLRSALLAAVAVAAPFAVATTASAADYLENFDALAADGSVTTSFTDSGITFSSPTDPGAFSVGNTGGLFNSLTGNALFASSTTGSTLDITFATPVNGVQLNFGIEDLLGLGGGDTLSFTTDAGGAGTATTSIPTGYLFPEGLLTYYGPAFSTLAITSASYQFAVDNVFTPEPASLGVLATGLLGLAAFRRRRA